jgi:hypothetical protein
MSVSYVINKFRLMPVPGPHRMRAVEMIGSLSSQPMGPDDPLVCPNRIILQASPGWLVETVFTRHQDTQIQWLCIEFDADQNNIKERLQSAFSVLQSSGHEAADLQVSVETEGKHGGWSYLPSPQCLLTGEQKSYVLQKATPDHAEEIYTSAGLARAIAVIYRQMAMASNSGWDDRTF